MSDDLIKRSDALSAAGDMSYIAFEIRKKLRMIPSAEPMPDYIDNILVVRHYCNGMVAMNEECYKRFQTRDEPKSGEWIETSDGTMCSNCHKFPYDDGEYHIVNWHSDFCPNCGSDMRKESK